ncbi:dihydropteroate synthase [Sulfurimonas sp. MAG313]|nr:dihydropteroate synthase [Sulfurimonas sp. MAG313]MDF1879718.1 dihydropteroate synthase [Sulfurimonas sp. MAG313]
MAVKIMGVLNANDDSFYAQSRFNEIQAIDKMQRMLEEGADIIDIGAVSSRPGSKKVNEKEELERLRPILDLIYEQKLYEKVELSLDSYSPVCISYALERGFRIINDITGLQDDKVCTLVGEYQAKAIIMHMQGNPDDMQDKPEYSNLLEEIKYFFQNKIEKAESFNIKDIVLDVGIGFGKTLEHNISLIKNLGYFKTLEKDLLIGASRKSMIDLISPSSPQERLPGSLALHLKAYDNGANIIRTHDVKEHIQAFKIHEALH